MNVEEGDRREQVAKSPRLPVYCFLFGIASAVFSVIGAVVAELLGGLHFSEYERLAGCGSFLGLLGLILSLVGAASGLASWRSGTSDGNWMGLNLLLLLILLGLRFLL